MICFGVDIGSTSIKAAILDTDLRQVKNLVQAPFPSPKSGLGKGRFELDPQTVLDATVAVLEQLFRIAPNVEKILWSGQMGGLVLVDTEGKPLSNYLSWRDQRTLETVDETRNYLQAIKGRLLDSDLVELGNELQAGSASSLLFWLAQNGQLPDGSFATIADFVIGRLCGVAPKMDPTQAIGLLNLKTNQWHQEAFERLGLQDVRWPLLADYRSPVGHWAIGHREIACHASLGDQPCALLGVGLTTSELSINISTGSQVSQRVRTFSPGNYQTRRFVGIDYLNTITHLPAGRSLNVLVNLLQELASAEGIQLEKSWEYIARQAAEEQSPELTANLCFFSGPLGSTGSISGITTENLTVGKLFRAGLENMADNYLQCADRLCANRAGLTLALSGGLTKAIPILRQLIEERFALNARETASDEETLLGLVELGRMIS
jgi:sugar (pentulose or hexulose) kinase